MSAVHFNELTTARYGCPQVGCPRVDKSASCPARHLVVRELSSTWSTSCPVRDSVVRELTSNPNKQDENRMHVTGVTERVKYTFVQFAL